MVELVYILTILNPKPRKDLAGGQAWLGCGNEGVAKRSAR
jgi:hypothetical protein